MTSSLSDNIVLPFKIENLDVQGRVVRLGSELDMVLSRHAYPAPVAQLLGEAMVLTAMLGASLKFDGRFILQTQSDGAISMLVCDMESDGAMRAYAKIDDEKYAAYEKNPDQTALLGEGHIAFTLDQGEDMENYQGIVSLEGDLTDAAHTYFVQSEQIATRVKLAVAPVGSTNKWRAGGILLQQVATEGGMESGAGASHSAAQDDWRRLISLLKTVQAEELLDSELLAETLLYRLFHEDGVRVFDVSKIYFACACSKGRIENLLTTFSDEDIHDMLEDGVIKVVCAFCNENYHFDPAQFVTLS